MEKGIKETQELLTGIKELVKLGKKLRDIVKDGIDTGDIPAAFNLVKEQSEKFEIYEAAFEGIGDVKAELEDLSKEEILGLFMQVIESVKEIEKA